MEMDHKVIIDLAQLSSSLLLASSTLCMKYQRRMEVFEDAEKEILSQSCTDMRLSK
jgi:hypothetical protein